MVSTTVLQAENTGLSPLFQCLSLKNFISGIRLEVGPVTSVPSKSKGNGDGNWWLGGWKSLHFLSFIKLSQVAGCSEEAWRFWYVVLSLVLY